jgi:glycosyltransferase involved in cell wall biosynthesis
MLFLNIAFYAFIVIVTIQVVFYLIFATQFKESTVQKNLKESLPISVIICAKNEAENLKIFLPSVIKQHYPTFQIVLINDASRDDSLEVMESFASQHSNIKIVDVKNTEAFWANKKYALTLGIKASKYDHFLFTDADCKPISNNWISEMSKHFDDKKSVVLGYGAYIKNKNSFLNKLIRFETVLTAMQYVSWSNLGMPYMGVGRNLAYTKKQFFGVNGFMKHMHIRSGDDDLFINEVANKNNTSVCLSSDSFTLSEPKVTFRSWFKQKRRHITTANNYKTKHRLVLGTFYSSQFLFWVLAIVLILFQINWQIIAGLIAVRFIIQIISYTIVTKKLNEKDVLLYVPFLELFLIGLQMTIFISNLISKPKHWK